LLLQIKASYRVKVGLISTKRGQAITTKGGVNLKPKDKHHRTKSKPKDYKPKIKVKGKSENQIPHT
jgi:hypothetical protein